MSSQRWTVVGQSDMQTFRGGESAVVDAKVSVATVDVVEELQLPADRDRDRRAGGPPGESPRRRFD